MTSPRVAFSSCLAFFLLSPVSHVAAQEKTIRVSVDSSGTQANDSSEESSISGDGRFIAFSTLASNLVPGDTNGNYDIFVHDCMTGVTERVSVDSFGTEAKGKSLRPAISADGSVVAFCCNAGNLVSGDTNHTFDVFVHDRRTGVTERLSVDSNGTEGNDSSLTNRLSISSDGSIVAFMSAASNLVPGDTNGVVDLFVHDRTSGITERVNVDSSGSQANDYATTPALSSDGTVVAFDSPASNLIASDTNGWPDVFLHDRTTGVTERVSVDSSGNEANFDSGEPTISADGQIVAFESEAWNLVPNDTNGVMDAFVRDRVQGNTERVSVDTSGRQGNGLSFAPLVAASGERVAFGSFATNLVDHDTNGWQDGFVRDRSTGTTELVTVDSSGDQGNNWSISQDISADGRVVVFISNASNLVTGDTNGFYDVFVHGPWLTLEADPEDPATGATLTFTTWTGESNGASVLVVTDVNGSPVFVPLLPGNFDAAGVWTFGGSVPPGLSGLALTFETVGFMPTGKVGVSNAFDVSFQ